MNDKYTTVFTAIMGKAGIVREEGNERISWGGNCIKNEIPKIHLNCSAIALRGKWKRSIERVKERNWVLHSDGSNNKEGRVGSG